MIQPITTSIAILLPLVIQILLDFAIYFAIYSAIVLCNSSLQCSSAKYSARNTLQYSAILFVSYRICLFPIVYPILIVWRGVSTASTSIFCSSLRHHQQLRKRPPQAHIQNMSNVVFQNDCSKSWQSFEVSPLSFGTTEGNGSEESNIETKQRV